MNERMAGKVAFITGAARGQGRRHAVRFAEEGADIIALDVAAPVPAQGAPAATPEDLAETVRLVEALDRRIVAGQADVRDPKAVAELVEDGVAQLGRLDVVVANAGIQGDPAPVALTADADWQAVIDTNLSGAFYTVKAAIPHLVAGGRGGAIVITSSSIALRAVPNMAAYGQPRRA
jgi:(+)-trans-carveol dehydrogenase